MTLAPVRMASLLGAPAEVVWASATSLEGINAELAPWLELSAPVGLERLTDPLPGPLGEVWGRVGLWFLRVLLVDRMLLRVVSVEAMAFVEESELLSVRVWRHTRSVVAQGKGCLITDEVTLEPRIPGTGWLIRSFVVFLFRHRHRRLRARRGGRAA